MGSEILLESGTNEVEILEFYVHGVSYGINVSKVKQIIGHAGSTVTATPMPREGQLGVLYWREQAVPAFDLSVLIKDKATEIDERSLFIITEFNGVINAFLTDAVNRIHRVSWDNLRPAGEFIGRYSSRVTGTLEVGGTDVLILDFEHIIAEVMPETNIYSHVSVADFAEANDRTEVELIFAEDSPFIRAAAVKELKRAGFQQIVECGDGKEAYDIIHAKMDEGQLPHLLLTDIEMPRMDGLTLCRKVREEMNQKELPVIFFSSLINDQMVHKCQSVGGNDWHTKPNIGKIIESIDNLTWKKSVPA